MSPEPVSDRTGRVAGSLGPGRWNAGRVEEGEGRVLAERSMSQMSRLGSFLVFSNPTAR